MARELGAAFISAHEPISQLQNARKTAFIGHDQASSDRVDFDAFANVRLASDTHSPTRRRSPTSPRAIATGNLDLVRRVSRYLDDDPGKGGLVQVLAENIQSFELKYMDPLPARWVETWDSSQGAAQLGRLLRRCGSSSCSPAVRRRPHRFETKATLSIQLPLNFAFK